MSYEKRSFFASVEICNKLVKEYFESDNFYGFCSPGLLAKFAVNKFGAKVDFIKIARSVAFDYRFICSANNIYFSAGISKALSNSHPSKVMLCQKLLDMSEQRPMCEVIRILKMKRHLCDSYIYQITGRSTVRKEFKQLGWSLTDLPYLPTALYPLIIRFIVNNKITDKKNLQLKIREEMTNGRNWWETRDETTSNLRPGFIYFAILQMKDNVSRIKVGLTEREVQLRHQEHKRNNRLANDTLFICRYVDNTKKEEASIINFLNAKGKLFRGVEEFVISTKYIAIIEIYVTSKHNFANLI